MSVPVRQNMKLAIRRFGGREHNSAGQTNIQCARAVERIRRTARLHTPRFARRGRGRGVACAYKASIRISRGGHGHVCRRGATTGAGERLSRRRASYCRWVLLLLGGPSLRAKRRAAARKIRCDAMRCAAVVSARPGPARQTGERTAGLHPSPMCGAARGRGYFILAANLNARARRRGAIRANPRLIDRAWPAGLLATWRLQCIALHSPNLLTLPCGASRRACVLRSSLFVPRAWCTVYTR